LLKIIDIKELYTNKRMSSLLDSEKALYAAVALGIAPHPPFTKCHFPPRLEHTEQPHKHEDI
jgi:hypothetical protein